MFPKTVLNSFLDKYKKKVRKRRLKFFAVLRVSCLLARHPCGIDAWLILCFCIFFFQLRFVADK